jgi:hypothetical protein
MALRVIRYGASQVGVPGRDRETCCRREKILRKVEQDRIRGHDDRALQRLKEALAEQPQEFLLAREAASLCFQLRRGVEGAGILRTALRRCPDARTEILQLAQDEFERTHPLELAELLFDTYLSQPDFEKARATVHALDARDLDKLLAKLRAKVQSLRKTHRMKITVRTHACAGSCCRGPGSGGSRPPQRDG